MPRHPIGVFAHSPRTLDPSVPTWVPMSTPKVWTSQVQMAQVPARVRVLPGYPLAVRRVFAQNIPIVRHLLWPGNSVPIGHHVRKGGIFGFGAGPDGIG